MNEPLGAHRLAEIRDHLGRIDDWTLGDYHARDLLAEVDRLAMLAQRTRDLKLIRLAISDPGVFVKRERFNDGDYETLPAWCARAVAAALRDGRGATRWP